MLKRNKATLIISSVIILLPVFLGLVFWNELPEQIVTHWDISGNPNGWSSKVVAVFVLPLILLAIHWLCVFVTARDPKNKDQSKKVFTMVLWIIPVVSLFSCGFTYFAAFERKFEPSALTLAVIGLMFVIFGNYMPKCKQNHTIGIKVKWALEDEENWNATHRLGGKLWVIGGLLILGCIFLPGSATAWALVIILPTMAVIPVIYSYVFYRKKAAGQKDSSDD